MPANRAQLVGLDSRVGLDAAQATDLSLAAAMTARWELDLHHDCLSWSPSMAATLGVADDGDVRVELLEVLASLKIAVGSRRDWQPYQVADSLG